LLPPALALVRRALLPQTERDIGMLQKKVCMLGSFSVGKSSLVRRFVASIFEEQYHTTIGVKVDKKVVHASGEDLTLVLWDIYGEDVFQKLRMSYLRGMHGYLLVVDGTRRQTLDDALALNDRVVREIGKVPAVLALNKYDLIDQWEIEPARETQLTAAGWTVEHTSAKTGDVVEKAFLHLAQAMLAK
jgi:small GTP-binding protein